MTTAFLLAQIFGFVFVCLFFSNFRWLLSRACVRRGKTTHSTNYWSVPPSYQKPESKLSTRVHLVGRWLRWTLSSARNWEFLMFYHSTFHLGTSCVFFCHEFWLPFRMLHLAERSTFFGQYHLSIKKKDTSNSHFLPEVWWCWWSQASWTNSCSLFCIQFDFRNYSLSQRLVIRFRDLSTKQQVCSFDIWLNSCIPAVQVINSVTH